MKKVYFAGSIRGGREDAQIYKSIADLITSLGCKVLTEHIGLDSLSVLGEDGPTDEYIYDRDMDWLKASDAVIAECTTPSTGVGYEIAFAENLGKPVLVLYRPTPSKKLSGMIGGNSNLKVVEYTSVGELKETITKFLQ